MKEFERLCSYEDLRDEFLEYDSGYICDIISEIADSNVDIYNYDLMQSVKDLYNSGAYEGMMQEFGSSNDLIKDLQQAQYYYNSTLLYDNYDELLVDFVNYQTKEKSLGLIENEQLEDLQDYVRMNIDDFDNNDMLENIIDEIQSLINDYIKEVNEQ
jgi:hypothetical protein